MIAGAAELNLFYANIKSLEMLGVLNTRDNETPQTAVKPFDQTSTGLVLGEGGAMLFLESYESAIKRKVEIICEITGFDYNCDTTFLQPLPNHVGGQRVIINTLR